MNIRTTTIPAIATVLLLLLSACTLTDSTQYAGFEWQEIKGEQVAVFKKADDLKIIASTVTLYDGSAESGAPYSTGPRDGWQDLGDSLVLSSFPLVYQISGQPALLLPCPGCKPCKISAGCSGTFGRSLFSLASDFSNPQYVCPVNSDTSDDLESCNANCMNADGRRRACRGLTAFELLDQN